MPKFLLSREVVLSALFVLLVTVPVVAFGKNKTIFVDKDAKGSEDGTANHPYHSIDQALKKAKSGTEVQVAKGHYKENITIPQNVKVLGRKKDRGDVVIVADNNDKPAVEMKHDSELDHVTIDGGRNGIRIDDGAKALVYDVEVKNSDRDGIFIEGAPRDKKYQAIIDKTEVRDSDRAGIYSERRFVVLMNSNIHDNDSDGIDFEKGTKAWIADTDIKTNHGSGAKFVIDDSSVTLKNDSLSNNKREGLEVSSYGANGYIALKKSSLLDNNRFGLAKVARNAQAQRSFGALVVDSGINVNRIERNTLGTISAVIRGF